MILLKDLTQQVKNTEPNAACNTYILGWSMLLGGKVANRKSGETVPLLVNWWIKPLIQSPSLGPAHLPWQHIWRGFPNLDFSGCICIVYFCCLFLCRKSSAPPRTCAMLTGVSSSHCVEWGLGRYFADSTANKAMP